MTFKDNAKKCWHCGTSEGQMMLFQCSTAKLASKETNFQQIEYGPFAAYLSCTPCLMKASLFLKDNFFNSIDGES